MPSSEDHEEVVDIWDIYPPYTAQGKLKRSINKIEIKHWKSIIFLRKKKKTCAPTNHKDSKGVANHYIPIYQYWDILERIQLLKLYKQVIST